jgi:hypothetical protein
LVMERMGRESDYASLMAITFSGSYMECIYRVTGNMKWGSYIYGKNI